MQWASRFCRWGLVTLLFGGALVSGVAWSVLEGVGPVASYRVDIGTEFRPMSASLHQLVIAWEREHTLMRRGDDPPESGRKSLFAFTKGSIVRKKVEEKVRHDTAWIPLPASWQASLVTTITNAHLRKEYFSLPALPAPVLADMVAKD